MTSTSGGVHSLFLTDRPYSDLCPEGTDEDREQRTITEHYQERIVTQNERYRKIKHPREREYNASERLLC